MRSKYMLGLLAMVAFSAMTSVADAQVGNYPGSLCTPYSNWSNPGIAFNGAWANLSTTTQAYMECGAYTSNLSSASYCVSVHGEDNNGSATGHFRVGARGAVSVTWSNTYLTANGTQDYNLQADISVGGGDAIYIEMGLPPCVTGDGTCNSYSSEISYLGRYNVRTGSCLL